MSRLDAVHKPDRHREARPWWPHDIGSDRQTFAWLFENHSSVRGGIEKVGKGAGLRRLSSSTAGEHFGA